MIDLLNITSYQDTKYIFLQIYEYKKAYVVLLITFKKKGNNRVFKILQIEFHHKSHVRKEKLFVF